METRNCRLLGHLDIPGGGQVVVQGGYVYIDHLKAPLGTSIVDVSDPQASAPVSNTEVPQGTHSHKVRVRGDIMMVNVERTSNDVYVDERGLVYLIDRHAGLDILEFSGGWN